MVVRRGRDQVGVDPGVGQCFDKASRDQTVDFFVGVMGSVVNGETIEEAQGGRVQQYAILDDCVGCKVEDVGEWFGHDVWSIFLTFFPRGLELLGLYRRVPIFHGCG